MEKHMSSVNYTVKLDEVNKKTAESVLKELGLNLSVAINAYVNAIARRGEIPFKLSLQNQISFDNFEEFILVKEFIEKMTKAEKQINDPNIKKISVEEALNNFDSKIKANA